MLSPSNYQALASRLPSWLTPPTIVLGLDLQGGSHVLLEVDQAASVVQTQVENLRDDVRRILREEKVASTGGIGAAAARRAVSHPRRGRRARRSCRSCACSAQIGTAPTCGGQAPLDIDATPERRRSSSTVTDAGIRRQGRAAPSTSRSKSSAAASTPSARPSPTSSARATTAFSSKCRACRTRKRSRRSSARRRSSNSASSREPGADPDRCRHARPDRRAGQAAGREAGDGAGRGSDRRPAGLRSAHTASRSSISASTFAAASTSAR